MDSQTLGNITKLFPDSKILILKRRLHNTDISIDVERNEILKLKVIPFEAISAFSKLVQGDLKSFVESHIESHICTNLTSLCRDYPYRIKYFVNVENGVSIYSECISVDILMTIIFGDLIAYFDFYEGKRDDILFKLSIIPQAFLSGKVQNVLTSIVGFSKLNIEFRKGYALIKNLDSLSSDINELIIVIPCLDSKSFKIVESLAKTVLRNHVARMFILVSTPSIYDARMCKLSYREFFMNYVRLLELSESTDRLYVCDSEATNVEIIVNRSTYLVSYEPRIDDDSEFIEIKDYSYIDGFTLKYLRDCLCSSHIVKNRKYLM
jgi:hypothetical protein